MKSKETSANDNNNTLLQLQTLQVASCRNKGVKKRVVGLWDPGSTLSFITFDLASKLSLQGRPVELEIVTVGGVTTKVNSKKYNLSVFDASGNDVKVELLGIEQISTETDMVDIGKLAELFTHMKAPEAKRPGASKVDLLLGFDYAAYHPVSIECVDHLLLMENRFGCLIAGTHPSVNETTQKLVKHAKVLHIEAQIEQFHSVESLGVSCSPKCGGCRCGKCQAGGKDMTLLEEKEYEMIKNGLKFDQSKGRYVASYPWVVDAKRLPSNRHFANALLRSTEKRMSQDSLHAGIYRKQIQDMLDRKVARKITEEELRGYQGPKFYLAHHDILNPQSVSTPMRVVFNSSARTRGMLSLNDCLAKGPCLLNKLLGILLRFRQDRFAFIGDIKKMFHSIDIPVYDQMTHLFLWRDMETEKDPETYAMTAVNMGDKPAAAIAQTALKMTAEEAMQEHPEASKIILENSYMDDIPASVASREEGLQRMREIEAILESKGFKMKNWTFAGQKPQREKSEDQAAVQSLLRTNIENEMGKVLGMEWETEEDVIQFRLCSLGDAEETTKRACLSTICRFYDPVGLLTPVTISAKIILRKIWAQNPKIDWDSPLPNEIQREWSSFRESLQHVRSLKFNRSIKPENALKSQPPILVIFSDGSKDAYGSVAYVRWKTSTGYDSSILVAKSRVAPLRIVDIVRLELCGAVLNTRLYTFIVNEIRDIKFEKVFHIIDSEIVQAMIKKESYGFRSFAANRIGEIQEYTEKENWYWVEGSLNVADLTTRSIDGIRELNTESVWQKGPTFLQLPVEQWPIKNEAKVAALPEIKKSFVGSVSKRPSTSLASLVKYERFSTFNRLVRTMAWIEKLQKKYKKNVVEVSQNSSESTNPKLLPADIDHAESTLVKQAQEELHPEIRKGKYKELLPTVENGVVVVGGRAERWVSATWNKGRFVLLPAKSHLSRLIAEKAHAESGHLGIEATIARIRLKYWIVGVRKLVRSIVHGCKVCKLKFRRMQAQRMSPLPIERIKPSPPFQNIGLDYFGPLEIKGEVQKRVRGKCYGLLFACDSARAVHAEIVQNYSTDAFLQALRRFAAIRGWPERIHSDNGSQLVGAASELKKVIGNLDLDQLQSHGPASKTTWHFCSADAPWQNGSTEALVKSLKRALNVILAGKVCSFAELQTVVYEAAQLVNQRPIGRKPGKPEEGTYLCPNDLLLGRCTNEVPQGPFLESTNANQRLNFIQEIVSGFWKRWIREVFPNLVIEPKWHTERRNVKLKDVVMVQDANPIRGEWTLGVVDEIVDSKDGRVRNVMIKYKKGDTTKRIQRAVQRLIVIVPADEEGETQE